MSSTPEVRIACLIPSATAICLSLGLEKHIVGITHECHESLGNDIIQSLNKSTRILTRNGLEHVNSQDEIHKAISTSSPPSINSCERDNTIPSFYPLLQDEIELAKPNVIITQDLCAVCAPTSNEVRGRVKEEEDVVIVSLAPTTLNEVAETFEIVGRACGVEDRGVALRNEWWEKLHQLQNAIQKSRNENTTFPNVFILEWLDPPFDSGHWTYQMMEFACVHTASRNKTTVKSQVIDWESVYKAQPDIVLVGCCGFDLNRNISDTLVHADKFVPLNKRTKVFACDGNSYIAQPGPALLQGVAILAQCAYHDQPNVLQAIDKLGIVPLSHGFQRIDFPPPETSTTRSKESVANCGIVEDIEDIATLQDGGFARIHERACQEGKKTYDDPETGYLVFTELALKKRGYCCGSGCRHCPYSHENVGDKARKIQQPSILYQQSSDCSIFSLTQNKNIKVLFNSGGKDSFLTIRALVKAYKTGPPFGLVLLTTFDAKSRRIAHQDVKIKDVVKQAKHLDITLVGIPLRRASGESYSSRIERGLEVIQNFLPNKDSQITSLVFGDLHLEHIKAWRDETFRGLGYKLEYPLWKRSYAELLADLEQSKVPCFVTASTSDAIKVECVFDRELYKTALQANVDGFGEKGEFHSLAKVWEVESHVALG